MSERDIIFEILLNIYWNDKIETEIINQGFKVGNIDLQTNINEELFNAIKRHIGEDNIYFMIEIDNVKYFLSFSNTNNVVNVFVSLFLIEGE